MTLEKLRILVSSQAHSASLHATALSTQALDESGLQTSRCVESVVKDMSVRIASTEIMVSSIRTDVLGANCAMRNLFVELPTKLQQLRQEADKLAAEARRSD